MSKKSREIVAWVQVRKLLSKLPILILLLVGAGAMILPYAWMITNSFKSVSDFLHHPYAWLPQEFTLDTYVNAWVQGRMSIFIMNSFIYAVGVTFIQLSIDSLAAYAFARIDFVGRDIIFLLLLVTMMLPGSVLLIPSYLIIWRLGLVDSYLGVVFPKFAQAFGIFLLRQFFLNIPREYEDAAVIDGCSKFRIYLTIILPLAKPVLVTLGIFLFIRQWNDFIWPLVVLSDWRKYPVTVGIALLHDSLFSWNWSIIFAALALATLPLIIIFFFGQKFIIGGLSTSGIKG